MSYNPTKCHQETQRIHFYLHCQVKNGQSSKCLEHREVLLSHPCQLAHLFYVNNILCHLVSLVQCFDFISPKNIS